jgi:hypothetical protein
MDPVDDVVVSDLRPPRGTRLAGLLTFDAGDREDGGTKGDSAPLDTGSDPDFDPGPKPSTSVTAGVASVEAAAEKYDPERESGLDPGRLATGDVKGVKSSSSSNRVDCCETERLCVHVDSGVSVLHRDRGRNGEEGSRCHSGSD